MSDSYHMEHRPADEDGIPAHDLTKNFPDDVYTRMHEYVPDGGEHGFAASETMSQLHRIKGKPDAPVRVYRTLPAEHAHHGFQPGDWVTLSKDYALEHGRKSDRRKDWPIITTRVRARHLHSDGDLHEFGYNGPPVEHTIPSFKGGEHQRVSQHADGIVRQVKRRAPKQIDKNAANLNDVNLLNFHHEEEFSGGSLYPNDCRITATHPEHGQVGYVNYLRGSRANSPILIKHLHVDTDHRRKGYGGAIMDALQETHPKAKINHGDRTDAGKAWWKSYGQGADRRGRTGSRLPLGEGVTIRYLRRSQPSTAHGNFGEQYGQHIEPAGRYMIEHGGGDTPEGWDTGEVHFHNPLHIDYGGDLRDPSNWKHQLHQRYDGATGNNLSRAIARDGHDGIITHDEYGTNEIVDLTHLHHHGEKLPDKRLFGPTFGLDHRLFDGDCLRDDVTSSVLGTLDGFWRPVYGPSWRGWARVYLAGSEASEWTSETLQGNNDFDVLVGVDYDAMRAALGGLIALMSDEQITSGLNKQFRELTARTDPCMILIDGQDTGPWSQTWFCNPDSYDITKIKPYAAYDITNHRWAVKPPHLPDWSIEDFPQGHALVQECKAVEGYVRAVLKLPEPYRSQQADALWKHLHGDRSRAFGPNGEGWFDSGNVIEKWLDQKGIWEKLARAHFDAVADPTKLLAPANWSNNPVPALAG